MANGYSSSERRENVRKQLRDRKGRWIEMGLKVRFSLDGNYAVGEVTGIDTENDEVSVETADGTTHRLGSKELESIGAKATIPKADDRETNRELTREEILDESSSEQEQEDSSKAEKERDLTREEIDALLLDLELEEDVIRDEGGDKDRAREIQRERLELQKKRAELNTKEREERDRSREKDGGKERDRSSGDKSPGAPGAPGAGNGDDESSREAPSAGDSSDEDKDRSATPPVPDGAGDGDDESSRERPGLGLPDMPGDGDDEHSGPDRPSPGLPNLPESGDDESSVPQETIDVLDIDRLEDGDVVTLVDPINGPEDVAEFRREDGIWAGSNDFEDLELEPEDLKDYIESRDPSDLLLTRAIQPGKVATPDTPVGTRVSFSLGGADGTGRIATVDRTTDTAEVSVEEGTVELPLEALTVPSTQDSELSDGPSDVYIPPASPIGQHLPYTERAANGPLTPDEQFAYNAARARLSILQGRGNRADSAAEVADLETFIEPLHARAVEEFSGDLSVTDSTITAEDYPPAEGGTVTESVNGGINPSVEAAELYGPDELAISSINADLRAGYADANVLALQDILLSSEITDNTTLFRGEYVPLEVAAQIAPGRALRNDSFMSTRKSAEAVDKHLADVIDPREELGKVPVSFRIEADAGSPGVDLSSQPGHSQEVLLPAGVELVVKDVGWDAARERLSVTASYDGTSVSSVADLTSLEENPLKSGDTTSEDLTNALQQTNEEVNRHQFNLAAAQLQDPESDTTEDERKLARARAVRDSIAALIELQGTSTRPESEAEAEDSDTSGNADTDKENVPEDASRLDQITNAAAAAELASTIEGEDEDSLAMRSALEAVSDVPGTVAHVVQRQGRTQAVAATMDEEDSEGNAYVRVGYLGAQDDEAGTAVLDAVLEDAAARDRGILLEPTPDSEDYWAREQGFVQDPFNTGVSANGLDSDALAQRVNSGKQPAEPVPAHSSGFSRVSALVPGSEIRDVQELDFLPEQAWVGVSSPGGPTELYQKDEDGAWVSATSSEDDPALTSEELFGLSAREDTSLWFEEVSQEVPAVESTGPKVIDVPQDSSGRQFVSGVDGERIYEGTEVQLTNGEVSGVVVEIEEDGQHVRVRDADGSLHRFPSGFLTSPNPTPNPAPSPAPAPGEGAGEGTPNPSQAEGYPGGRQPEITDGSGLALEVGFEVMDSQDPEYFGKIVAIEEDGEYVNILGEDGTSRRRKAEDLDLSVSIEMELEE